ncbi:uncharacterized protein LOC128966968 [Indicator indicator]|uniref:uncharacterized protein LOC128966968 n=1 Tax=Indicator indicator TaxID=1002788 RepID=UPI0023DF5D08|nr:uncharacterized protein LOC128966968 [Indicator indicator]
MTLRLCCACIFSLLLPGLSDGGKLLVVPTVESHWLSLQKVVEKLSERGHEVVVLMPEVSWQMKTTQAYTVKTHPVSVTLEKLDNSFRELFAAFLQDLPLPMYALVTYKSTVNIFRTFYAQCRDLFSSKETLQYLNQSSFDAVLTDPTFMCGATLANYLSLPYVFFMRGFPCNLHYDAPQCPSPLSYISRGFSFNSDHMTFLQRVENALIALLNLFICNYVYEDALKLSSEVLQRDVSLMDLVDSAAIWLLRSDFVFEYVRPLMPNMVFVGGINCVQKKALPKIEQASHPKAPKSVPHHAVLQAQQWPCMNPPFFGRPASSPLAAGSSPLRSSDVSVPNQYHVVVTKCHGPYRKMTLRLCCACIFILLLPVHSDGGKLLIVPMVGSHWLSLQKVVEKLSERGHEVVVLMPEVSWQMKTTQAYTVKTHPVSLTLEELDNGFREYLATHLKDLSFPMNTLAMYKSSVQVFNVFFTQCRDLFSSKETLQYLNQSSFDAVLTDPAFMCGAIVANYLSIPYVFLMRGFPCNLHYEAPQCPSPLSYIPRLFSFNSDHMTFLQRVENALIALLELVYCNGFYEDAVKLSSEVLQRDVSLMDLLNSASIWLLRFDFVFDYVRPVMPNMVFVGGINCVQKKALPKFPRPVMPNMVFIRGIHCDQKKKLLQTQYHHMGSALCASMSFMDSHTPQNMLSVNVNQSPCVDDGKKCHEAVVVLWEEEKKLSH